MSGVVSGDVRLRVVRASDLPIFFAHQADPVAVHMAAFTAEDPTDRVAFMTRWQRILAEEAIVARTILVGEEVAGHVVRFERDAQPEVTYWLARAWWGRGLATAALSALLREVTERPIFARAARDNVGSIRVLEKCGFVVSGEDRGFAAGRGRNIDEVVLVLRSHEAH